MANYCKPTIYAVVSGQNISYGFRCSFCNIPSRRYSTQQLRDERLAEHKNSAKKS